MSIERPSKDEYFMQMALLVATRHTCPKRAVGCVITDGNDRVLATGYNGNPRSLPACIDVPCGGGTPGGTCLAVHAEISALMSCHTPQKARTLYCTCSPCLSCMQAVMASPIERIVFGEYHKSWDVAQTIWTGDWEYLEC